MKVTENDLLDAIRTALTKPASGTGSTVRELALARGCAEERVRRALQVLASEGRLEVARVPVPSIDGRMFQVPAYRIKSK